MGNWSLSCLPWLPAAPDDFQERCKAVAEAKSDQGLLFQRLATYQLNTNQTILLARHINVARLSGNGLAPLVPFRLGILSNATMELINPALVVSAARYGVVLEIINPPLGQVVQEAFSAASLINSLKPHAVLLALDHRALPFEISPVQSKKTL